MNTMLLGLLFFSIAGPLLSAPHHFPVTGEMKKRVSFWKRVYTEITSRQAFVHDSDDLTIIYKTIALPKSRRAKRRIFRREKKKIERILHSMAKKKSSHFTDEEQDIFQRIGEKNPQKIRKLSKTLRTQIGLKDRYYRGLIRSYSYLHHIKKIYSNYGLPKELVYLPHVESSFNYNAYSKAGAAGIWQFMRSTARIYGLKVSYVVDERRDIFKSTKASAKFLKDNHRQLKSWPLALTAYNHGVHSIKKAVSTLKTRNINTIVANYTGRRFGFASKNFYATFMATVEISQDLKKYFPSFIRPKQLTFSQLKLSRPHNISQLKKAFGLSEKMLKKYNPSIRRSAYLSNLPLHKGFVLYLPRSHKDKLKQYELALSKIKASKQANAKKSRIHIVSRGDNLHDIANIYGTNIHSLASFNNITNSSRIYPGRRLRIPSSSQPTRPFSPPKISSKNLRASKTLRNILLPFTKKKSSISLESYHLDLHPYREGLYILKVESEETLGHYAEWAEVSLGQIKKLNGLQRKSSIYLGQKLQIKIAQRRIETFVQLRRNYHRAIQEDFFNSYSVADQEKYFIKKGETLNQILRENSLPFWLVRREQPEGTLDTNIKVGQVITLPKVIPISNDDPLIINSLKL